MIGNYYEFLQALKQKKKTNEKEHGKVEKKIKEMKKKGESKKNIQEFLDKCKVKKPERDYVVNINFGEPAILSGSILSIEDVGFGYEINKPILENINFGLDLESRITIVGPNGAGKSTFINLLVGNLKPVNGYIYKNHSLRFAYYNQHFIDILPMDLTPIEYLKTVKELPYQDIRRLLGTIGLEGSEHVKLIGKLSGGRNQELY